MKTMLAAFFKPDMWPVRRFAAIVFAVCLMDAIYVFIAPQPLPVAAMIPASVPLLVVLFVVVPLSRTRRK